MPLKSWFTSSMISSLVWFPLVALSTILIFAYFLFQRTLWPCFCLQRTGTESSCHITGATWWSHLNRELQCANLRWLMEKNSVYSKYLCLPRTWQVWNKRSQIKKAECIVQISPNKVFQTKEQLLFYWQKHLLHLPEFTNSMNSVFQQMKGLKFLSCLH